MLCPAVEAAGEKVSPRREAAALLEDQRTWPPVGGFWKALLLARLLSRILGRRLLPRLGVNETGSSALQAIAFYVLLCSFALMVLDFVNFPITGFAFMGGAIAIVSSSSRPSRYSRIAGPPPQPSSSS